MIHYSFLAELASRPAAAPFTRPSRPETVIHENILFNPKIRNVKGMIKKEDMVPYYSITDKEDAVSSEEKYLNMVFNSISNLYKANAIISVLFNQKKTAEQIAKEINDNANYFAFQSTLNELSERRIVVICYPHDHAYYELTSQGKHYYNKRILSSNNNAK